MCIQTSATCVITVYYLPVVQHQSKRSTGAAAANIHHLWAVLSADFVPLQLTSTTSCLLVVFDDLTPSAIVVADILGLPKEVCDLAKEQVAQHTNIPASHVLIAATHTHSAATPRGPKGVFWKDEISDYGQFLAKKFSDSIRRAVNNLEPAQIGWGVALEPREVFNRRWFSTDASIYELFGGVDK